MSGDAKTKTVAESVADNTALKEQVDSLDRRLVARNEEIRDMGAALISLRQANDALTRRVERLEEAPARFAPG